MTGVTHIGQIEIEAAWDEDEEISSHYCTPK